MNVTQFVMAYGVEQDRLRALLPEGCRSLRPVLRVNAELRQGHPAYVELNTAVERDGVRGWLNIARWNDALTRADGKTVTFTTPLLEIAFTGVGIAGGCPAEKDNDGCFYPEGLRPAEVITAHKEFCDCRFAFLVPDGAHGVSIGKTLPAVPQEPQTVYPRLPLTAENAAAIPCRQVLGAYSVAFPRQD